MNTRRIEVYSRRDCHLCDEVKELFDRRGLAYQTLDVDADPQLAAKYGLRVPVVLIDGQERFFGRVDERLLDRLLAATGAAVADPSASDRQP